MRVLFPLLAIPALFGQVPAMKAIVGATVVDPSGARVPDTVVLLKGDRIEKVGPRAKVKIPEGAERVEATGQFLVPGLVDAHVHFFQSGGLYTRPDGFDLRSFKSYAEDQREIRERLDRTFARYETRFGEGLKEHMRGINTLTLHFDGQCWWVMARHFQNEDASTKLPELK